MQELFEIKGDLLVRYHGYEEHVVIPEGITAIGIEAFAECESMRSVVVPASVTAIGRRAFSKCYPKCGDRCGVGCRQERKPPMWRVAVSGFNAYGRRYTVDCIDGKAPCRGTGDVQ